MQKKYSVIVFDLGNVLLPFNYDVALAKLDKVEKNLGKKFRDFVKSNYKLHRGFERGDIPEEEFLRTMLAALDFNITFDVIIL